MADLVLVDTDVLVDYARGVAAAADLLAEKASGCELGVCCVTEMELIAGCRNKAELAQVRAFLSDYRRVELTPAIGDAAVELMARFRLSHGLLMPDALISATAVITSRCLLTRNLKHFSYVPGIDLLSYQP